MTKRLCLTTVTTDSYLVGTLVTLHSFLSSNRWFAGDIVVIAQDLAEESRRRLELVDPRIRILAPSPQLGAQCDAMAREFPAFAEFRVRFHALEAFRLDEYERVLMCDSDLLFRGSIEPLFARSAPLIACGDGPYYKGDQRAWQADGVPPTSFNSGLMLVDRTMLTPENHRALLALVNPQNYRRQGTKLADQMVLNLHFGGQATFAEPRYNFLLEHEAAIRRHDGTTLAEALVLHYNRSHKPWKMAQVLEHGLEQPVFIKACALWYDALAACLSAMHLRGAR